MVHQWSHSSKGRFVVQKLRQVVSWDGNKEGWGEVNPLVKFSEGSNKDALDNTRVVIEPDIVGHYTLLRLARFKCNYGGRSRVCSQYLAGQHTIGLTMYFPTSLVGIAQETKGRGIIYPSRQIKAQIGKSRLAKLSKETV